MAGSTGTPGAPQSPLCDPRLDDLIAGMSELFDCVVISHIPLSQQDGSVSQDVNETRIWIRGSGRYDDDPVSNRPSAREMRAYLESYVELIKDIHEKQDSLLFHPYLFGVDKNSPPICHSRILRKNIYEPLKRAPAVGSTIEFDEWLGYHRTETLAVYEIAHVDEIRERVIRRAAQRAGGAQRADGSNLAVDAEIALQNQHSVVHDYLASMLDSRSSTRWSTFLACPSGLLQSGAEGFDAISPNVVGMFWIAIIGHSNWRAAERDAEQEIIRSVWTLLTSAHLARRQAVVRRTGRRDFLSTVSHDLRKLVRGISGETAPAALDQIQRFLLNMLRESILEVPESDRAKPAKDHDLIALMWSAADQAARLEEIVLLSRQDQIGSPDVVAAGFETAVAAFRRLLDTAFAPTVAGTFRATSSQHEAFEMALVAAFRNIIAHTRAHGDPEARVRISLRDNTLEIRNIFRTSKLGIAEVGAPGGTVGSLRYYASLYAPNSRRRGTVTLKREAVDKISPPCLVGNFYYVAREHWLTRIPIPLSEEART
jgi:signal transduction histidine kinase